MSALLIQHATFRIISEGLLPADSVEKQRFAGAESSNQN